MKCLTTGILALAVAGMATTALAADYEIFAPAYTSASEGQHWAVERLDYMNKHLYHCDAFFDRETKKLTGQCTERPGFENGCRRGKFAESDVSVFRRIARGLLADRPDNRENRVLYLGPCTVHGGNPELDVGASSPFCSSAEPQSD